MPEVGEFIERIRVHLPNALFAVCDNTEVRGTDVPLPPEVVVCRRPDNPGYMEGALVAWEALRSVRPSCDVDWVVISNTDLQVVQLASTSLDGFDPGVPLVLAPRITEGVNSIEKNPHLVRRRSRRRLWINHLATKGLPLALGYLMLSAGRMRFARRRDVRGSFTPRTVYAPYGAMMFFSRAFWDAARFPRYVPLLAEEFVVAEMATLLGASVVYEPAIHVHHDANTTTGPKLTRRRAAMLSRAFAYIDAWPVR